MGKQVISNAGEKVKLTITSQYHEIPSGEQGDFLPMLVRVEAPPAVKKHVPIDLVALLDVCGSMNTEVAKNTITRLDLLKKAMKFVIKHLHDDDELAIVPFNEKILTNHTTDLFRISGQRMFAQNKVDKLMAKGDTAFGPALEQAVKILDGRTDKKRVGVIMLLSDGLDSRKAAMYPVRAEVLKKYPVHTFGICAHDPNVLLSISQQSCGTYSFVDDKELGKIADAFAVFLGGLSSIVAVDVVISISSYRTWRSEVKRIGCGFESREITQPDAVPNSNNNDWKKAEIRIGMLYAGEVKNFIAYFQIEPNTTPTNYVWLEITYKDTPDGSSIAGDGHRVYLSTGKQAGDSEENSLMVREQIVQFSAMNFLSTLLTEFNNQKNTAGHHKRDRDAGDAQIHAGSTLETQWAEFIETMDDDLMDDLDLDDLEKEVQEMVSRLKSGAGMSYMCSWVSSQQMQRATTLGSVDTVGTQFFTPAMDMMLHESKKYHVQSLSPQEGGVGGGGGGGGGASASASAIAITGLAQRVAAWSKLKGQAQGIFSSKPMDTDLEAVWKDFETAINKAMSQDINMAIARGES